jgi:hypothetical protein
MELYALVISESPETTLKGLSEDIRSFKKADWLYEGIAHKENVTKDELKAAIKAHSDFLPKIIVDGKVIVTASSFNEGSWEKNLDKFIELSEPSHISFWIIEK